MYVCKGLTYSPPPPPTNSLLRSRIINSPPSIQGNEKEVGRGISASGLSRSDLWITSKLWNTAHRPSNVRPALEKTLSGLGVEYLDLYLMHWPVAFDPTKSPSSSSGDSGPVLDKHVSILDTWAAMEDLVRANLTRFIGISNFAKGDVEKVLRNCSIKPAAHEFETHPYLQQQDFVDWHSSEGVGIPVIAYSPLANMNSIYKTKIPPIVEDPFFVGLAEEKNATPAQVILSWGIQRGTVVIPKSVHKEWIEENLEAETVPLTLDEMERIAGRDKRARFNNPSKSWGVHLFEHLDGAAPEKEDEYKDLL
ncbi:MAG: hypothetical protein M1834_002714 [Cirrosporium novae-zelandiae]|nr:MAG: hypothetical protein M1834_002714 [Cirrosporium novae-zelandiae]